MGKNGALYDGGAASPQSRTRKTVKSRFPVRVLSCLFSRDWTRCSYDKWVQQLVANSDSESISILRSYPLLSVGRKGGKVVYSNNLQYIYT